MACPPALGRPAGRMERLGLGELADHLRGTRRWDRAFEPGGLPLMSTGGIKNRDDPFTPRRLHPARGDRGTRVERCGGGADSRRAPRDALGPAERQLRHSRRKWRCGSRRPSVSAWTFCCGCRHGMTRRGCGRVRTGSMFGGISRHDRSVQADFPYPARVCACLARAGHWLTSLWCCAGNGLFGRLAAVRLRSASYRSSSDWSAPLSSGSNPRSGQGSSWRSCP